MTTKTATEEVAWRVLDRTYWDRGPWDNEPEDRIEWRHEGVPCLMVRNDSGAWCGYVGVEPGHPWHGLGYDETHEAAPDLEVHGGLTYAAACAGHICHVPQPGEPAEVWWLGFDCAHSGDRTPQRPDALFGALNGFAEMFGGLRNGLEGGRGYAYRDVAYVKAEVTNLATAAIAARKSA